MTDLQLYLTIGLPSMLFALNFLVVVWQARGLERTFNARFDGLEKVMNSKFEAVYARFEAVDARFQVVNAKFEEAKQGLFRVEQVLDARLKHLEER